VPAAATHAQTAARAGATPAARTVVTFTWGGGLADQMGALPLFQHYGMHATFYVPSGLVCQPATDPGCTRLPYLTLGEIRQIAADGNEIGGLSVAHIPLTTGIPAAEAQREICDDRVNLTSWGFRVTDFAYPFALVNHTLEVLTRRCGYNSGLGTGQLRGAGLCTNCPLAETLPPSNPYLLRAPVEVASVGTIWSPATFEKIVTGAQRHGGGWIIFTIHDMCARSCALGVTVPELSSVLAWLSQQAGHGVSVRTVRQVIGGPVRPACRLRRGKRGQLQLGPALGRHAGHQPVQPGPGALLEHPADRVQRRGRGPRGRGRWRPQISPPRPPRCLAGNRPRLS
jgi:peptidoglycan/xylan/chitin deacetylase (PgdA/CDA1 family)